MTSFAWGLAPSIARAQVPLAPLGGCTVTDAVWRERVAALNPSGVDPVNSTTSCTISTPTTQVPKMLLRELLITVARSMLIHNDDILNVPRAKVFRAMTNIDYPPTLWLITLTACFPCDGTPVTRCLDMTALLDASRVERSRVLTVEDVGVVPAEQVTPYGVLPVNALSSELTVSR